MEEKTKQDKPLEKQPVSILEEVRKEKAELEALRDEIKEERAKIEELRTDEILSGKSNSSPDEQLTPEEKKKKGAMDFFKGSGIEKSIAKYG